MTDLADSYQLGHRADDLLDRHSDFAAMQVVQVDRLDAEPTEARLDRLAHIGGVVAGAHGLVGDGAGDAELGGDRHLVPAALRDLTDCAFAVSVAVDVGGVDEGHADVEGMVQGGQALLLRANAIHPSQCHGTKAETADRQSVPEKD